MFNLLSQLDLVYHMYHLNISHYHPYLEQLVEHNTICM